MPEIRDADWSDSADAEAAKRAYEAGLAAGKESADDAPKDHPDLAAQKAQVKNGLAVGMYMLDPRECLRILGDEGGARAELEPKVFEELMKKVREQEGAE
jgi:hypothetical protein